MLFIKIVVILLFISCVVLCASPLFINSNWKVFLLLVGISFYLLGISTLIMMSLLAWTIVFTN